jgi:hypothetical protein
MADTKKADPKNAKLGTGLADLFKRLLLKRQAEVDAQVDGTASPDPYNKLRIPKK